VPAGPQVADTRDPERAGRRLDPGGCLLDDTDATGLEGGSHAIVVKPSVVIAQDGHNSRRRAEMLRLRRDFLRRDLAPADDAVDHHDVAEDADDVGSCRIGAAHDVAEPYDSVEGRAHMKIGQDRDSQRSLRG
jgi:hypothetical protein